MVLVFTITLAAQVDISQGLKCYLCEYFEKDDSGESSATCEKNPTLDELFDVPVLSSSQMGPSSALPHFLTALSASHGISLNPTTTAPNASTINAVLNPDNSSMTKDRRTGGRDTTYLYCLLAKFNHKPLGRIVIRLAADLNEDVGATYCSKTLSSEIEVSPSDISNVNNCYCNSPGCNGKNISGAEKAGQSMVLLLFSVGLAILNFWCEFPKASSL